MFFNHLSQTKKLFFIFESFILFLIIITIFQMQNIYDNSILVKESDISKTKNLQIILLILFGINYIANAMSKYEMTGFRGNKYNLYELFHMTLSEMTVALLSLSILVFMVVDFLIDFNMYKRFSKNVKKRIYIIEGQESVNLV